MKFEYQLTVDDLVEASRLYQQHRGRLARGVSLLLPVLLVLAIQWQMDSFQRLWNSDHAYMLVLPLALAPLAAWLLNAKPYLRFVWKRQFQKSGLGDPIGANVSEQGLEFAGRHGSGLLKWSGVSRWLESPGIFSLYTQSSLFYVLPKRSMQPDQIESLRVLLLEKVGPLGRPLRPSYEPATG